MTEECKCSHKGRRKVICRCITIFFLLVGATALTLWLVYRPHNPQFKVIGTTINELNFSAAPLVTTNMQFTVVTRNPNKRISIYYDSLSVSVWYRNQAITPKVMLAPFFHKHHRIVTVSPVVCGGEIPTSVEVANGLVMDEAYGVMGLSLVLMGRLRWKLVGAIKTAHYGIYVKCDVLLDLKKGFVGQVPLLGSPGCKVDI
ncbi:NDR1/HIN1-like protein 12 [Juglans microcarpa x Juglans regia]|uniref:NDR1/HIN1-like protein 12 n=1 Tax=Juglans microcarpa x Juglans regia TaxID=2249226 RepID=UPI001B7F2FD1|nr:NDR1/HIN1-like protein 12 [Juglans microcarpa x Juglans regia]